MSEMIEKSEVEQLHEQVKVLSAKVAKFERMFSGVALAKLTSLGNQTKYPLTENIAMLSKNWYLIDGSLVPKVRGLERETGGAYGYGTSVDVRSLD